MRGVSGRIADLPSYLLYVLLNPTFDLRVAVLLYVSIAVLILLVAVAIAMVITRPRKERRSVRESAPSADPRVRLAVGGAVVLFLGLAWLAAGYTTSDPSVCRNCHWPAAKHARAAAGSDAHSKVACVSCHEGGGVLGRYVTAVPSRLVHVAEGGSSGKVEDYGLVTVAACSSCHRSALSGVSVNRARGLKVSHKEPMAASATCVDCHTLRGGVVGTYNAGMTPCLRCHDAKVASAKCTTCHDENTASAARARTTSFADVQVPVVTCGGCHDEKRECDRCHGLRMPHTAAFLSYAHARAAAVDFWYNGGKVCSRCHTSTRRPCQKCHGQLLGKGHGAATTWLARGHQKATADSCDSCHRTFAYRATRDFCKDVCHTPAAAAESPR